MQDLQKNGERAGYPTNQQPVGRKSIGFTYKSVMALMQNQR